MTVDLLPLPPPGPGEPARGGAPSPEEVRRLVALFLAGKSPDTLRAYGRDLRDLSAFLGTSTVDQAAHALLGRGQGEANALALGYRNNLLERGLAPSTVARRLYAIRSLVKLAKLLGLVAWTVDVPGPRVEALRDTRGPGREGVAALLTALAARTDAKGARDRAILRLLHDLGLRRAEVVSLDIEHVDLRAGTLAVLGKGKLQRLPLSLPSQTKAALETWLAARGPEPGPLFTSCDPAKKGSGRLSGVGIYRVIRRLGEQAGIKARPHGIRHTAITTALDATKGDLRASASFSRHADWRTLAKYDDGRRNVAGEVAKRVADTL